MILPKILVPGRADWVSKFSGAGLGRLELKIRPGRIVPKIPPGRADSARVDLVGPVLPLVTTGHINLYLEV